jgi:hypothetical protein
MVTIFFTPTRLLVLNFLPKGTKFNQDYFIDTVLPNIYSEKIQMARTAEFFSPHGQSNVSWWRKDHGKA